MRPRCAGCPTRPSLCGIGRRPNGPGADDGRERAAGRDRGFRLRGSPGAGPALVLTSADPNPATVARRRTDRVDPLSQDAYAVRFTASGATVNLLRQAQDLTGRSVPDGEMDPVIQRALELLVRDLLQKRAGIGRQPRRSALPAAWSRTVPAAVRRTVWMRDGGRCAFVGAGGHRCDETRSVEFHHVKPWAAGGLPTAENIALRCRAHNQHEAEVFFAPIRAARA